MPSKVVNIRDVEDKALLARVEYVYIGRGRGRTGRWGNPFIIGRDGDRGLVIRKFKQLLWQRIQSGEVTKEILLELDGKVLVCHCKPEACHGDVLLDAIEWAKGEG